MRTASLRSRGKPARSEAGADLANSRANVLGRQVRVEERNIDGVAEQSHAGDRARRVERQFVVLEFGRKRLELLDRTDGGFLQDLTRRCQTRADKDSKLWRRSIVASRDARAWTL
jgi:hypothetical protein